MNSQCGTRCNGGIKREEREGEKSERPASLRRSSGGRISLARAPRSRGPRQLAQNEETTVRCTPPTRRRRRRPVLRSPTPQFFLRFLSFLSFLPAPLACFCSSPSALLRLSALVELGFLTLTVDERPSLPPTTLAATCASAAAHSSFEPPMAYLSHRGEREQSARQSRAGQREQEGSYSLLEVERVDDFALLVAELFEHLVALVLELLGERLLVRERRRDSGLVARGGEDACGRRGGGVLGRERARHVGLENLLERLGELADDLDKEGERLRDGELQLGLGTFRRSGKESAQVPGQVSAAGTECAPRCPRPTCAGGRATPGWTPARPTA